MPPRKPLREVLASKHLRRRVAMERERRGWTYEKLAKQMTDAGCAVNPSAIYKIEKGRPPRRIDFDEAVGFSRVFDLSMDDLLLPPEVALSHELAALFNRWDKAAGQVEEAERELEVTWTLLQDFITSRGHTLTDEVLRLVRDRMSGLIDDAGEREAASAYWMWKLTNDDAWRERVVEDAHAVMAERSAKRGQRRKKD